MKKKEIVYAFIDSQNLNLGVKSQGWNLDFKKFRVFLKNKYNVKKAYLFIGFIPDNSNLYDRLKSEGYVLVFKPVLQSRNYNRKIKIKGNVDAELVLHAMIQYKNYSKAIIVSGDVDFHCLVEFLDSKRKLGKIIAPNKKYSSLLRKFAKYIVNVNLFKKNLEE